MGSKKSILVLCTGNSARSQMAEGIIRHIGTDAYDVESAGTLPSAVRPEAIAVLGEIGIDISFQRSQSVNEFLERDIDFVLTVCDDANEHCPYFPARTRIIHRSFEDPASVSGTERERLEAFRQTRDRLLEYLPEFLREIGQEG